MILNFEVIDEYYSSFPSTRKRLELLGYVPMGTYCYVCGNGATHDYNNQRVCESCFSSLKDVKQESYVCSSLKYHRVGDNEWFRDDFLKPTYTKSSFCNYRCKEVNFNTKYPDKMLKLAFSNCYSNTKYEYNINGRKCFNCSVYVLETCEDVCRMCIISAIMYYFELESWHYFYLKEILPNIDIARYVILHYLDIKLSAL